MTARAIVDLRGQDKFFVYGRDYDANTLHAGTLLAYAPDPAIPGATIALVSFSPTEHEVVRVMLDSRLFDAGLSTENFIDAEGEDWHAAERGAHPGIDALAREFGPRITQAAAFVHDLSPTLH